MKKLKGSIQLIIGPMFSGKTTELIERVRRYRVVDRNCLVVQKSWSDRHNQPKKLISHDLANLLEGIDIAKIEHLEEVKKLNYEQREVIAIDEGQFFEDLAEKSETFANDGKVVIISGLSGTFQREAFRGIIDLVPKAEEVSLLNAICVECGEPAHFSKRIVNSSEVVVIGGAEAYKAVCREHFFNEPSKK